MPGSSATCCATIYLDRAIRPRPWTTTQEIAMAPDEEAPANAPEPGEDISDAPQKAARAKAAAKPKAATVLADADRCRWGHGRYYSPANAPDCKLPKAKGKQLCGSEGLNHEKAMIAARKVAKAAGTAKVITTPRAMKAAGTTPKAPPSGSPVKRVPRVPKNSGGATRTVKPPVPEMHTGVVIPRVTVAQPSMVMLATEGVE